MAGSTSQYGAVAESRERRERLAWMLMRQPTDWPTSCERPEGAMVKVSHTVCDGRGKTGAAHGEERNWSGAARRASAKP